MLHLNILCIFFHIHRSFIYPNFLFLFSSTVFIKFWFGGHFIALGQGISKLFLFFFWDVYYSNILTSKFWIPGPVVNYKKYFYQIKLYDVSEEAYWNSNIKSILKNDGKCLIDKRKTVLFWKFSNFTAFLLLVQSIFKNDSIFVFSVLMRVFWTFTRLYLKKNIFKTLLQGDPKLWSQNFQEI